MPHTKLFFHVGLHKTATTWLQNKFFQEHPEITILNNYQEPWNDEFLNYLVTQHDRSFDPEICRKKFFIYPNSKSSNHNVNLISAERLSGHPFSGGYDTIKIAERIRVVFPFAKIILVVRRQADIIKSTYKQLVMEGATLSYADLFLQEQWKTVSFDLDYYRYDLLLKKYWEFFGEKRVKVLFFEDFKIEKKHFLQDICSFMGVSFPNSSTFSKKTINKSKKNATITVLRALNNFRKTELNPTPIFCLHESIRLALIKIAEVLPHKQPTKNLGGDFFHTYFEKGNIKFAKMLNRNSLFRDL